MYLFWSIQVKAVYVKNLPKNVTQEQLKKLFDHHGKITKVVLPPAKSGQEKNRIGFVHFSERSSAMKALKNTEKYELDGTYFCSSSSKKFHFTHHRMGLIFDIKFCLTIYQVKFWSVLLQSHRQIKDLGDQIAKSLDCFLTILLVLDMALLGVVMVVLLIQDMVVLVLLR